MPPRHRDRGRHTKGERTQHHLGDNPRCHIHHRRESEISNSEFMMALSTFPMKQGKVPSPIIFVINTGLAFYDYRGVKNVSTDGVWLNIHMPEH